MNHTNMLNPITGYFNRNAIWIMPLLACLVLGLIPLAADRAQGWGLEIGAMAAIAKVGLVLGIVVLGATLKFCDTTSARILLYVLLVVVCTLFAYTILREFKL